MKLIGITGLARSGKDTLAKHLWSEHSFTRIGLADPLKKAAQILFGLSEEQTQDPDFKEVVIPYWGLSPRQIFQQLGTDALQTTFGRMVMVKRWAISYNVRKDSDDIVVPDVRFNFEATAIRNLGGVIVQVLRGSGLAGEAGEHVSEQGIGGAADFVIDNSGTIDELYAKVDEILEVL